ncbi:hypothetical protein [Sorangium sp. So ce388]|uniref:hypothetical protein n=1 Tax=Sorangium sp. So ce388 TaxID=3133309 RepID=UPI003F5BCA09
MSSPALSTGVQSPAPDVALDLRGRSELASGLLDAAAAPRSTRGCGVEPAPEELGVASNGTRPAPEELAGTGPLLDQVDGDGPELARRFYLEEMMPGRGAPPRRARAAGARLRVASTRGADGARRTTKLTPSLLPLFGPSAAPSRTPNPAMRHGVFPRRVSG